ncbi:vWA domain-containing protein [Segetibacter aerophilus]|uniref:BatA protein n=1 Tax=Segetibacter aerophilus TaxID=670293 RepID=A0A512BDD8_9BACT|nr:VWA domain-containing protein [Segetibacter aerophilus]GEO09970.1 BatA protein [Segetibacter aerophilus]
MLYQWFQNITFHNSEALSLLFIIPIIAIWYYGNVKKRQGSMLVTTTHFLSDIRSSKTWLQNFPFVLRCIALACLIVALARPQHKFSEQQTEGEGIDIVLCFDISGSMTEKDFTPNRLEASKEVAQSFVNERTGDRIGVVIFSRQSFTLCPITTDKTAILSQIANIHSGYLEEEGTSIGSGLATSVDRLKNQKTKSKIVILLTDGVDFGGLIPPDIAKEMAKLYGIKVYTIGVGSEKEIDEQVQTPYGKMNNRKKLEFNEGLLKNIAVETGGQYFHAVDQNALKNIYASINKLEKTKVEITSYDRFTEEFLPWLVIAFVFLVIEAVLRYTVFKKFP